METILIKVNNAPFKILSVPNKTCIASTDDNPCELFETIDFPVDEFFPPQICDFPGAKEAEAKMNFN